MNLTYLAAPYTSPKAGVREDRAELAAQVAARLSLMYGQSVFSPISHGHMLDSYIPPRLSTHKFWMKHCLPFLRASSKLVLLPIKGWRESKGVQEELRLAKILGIPVEVYQTSDGMFAHSLDLIDLNEAGNLDWTLLWDSQARLNVPEA